jgi:hypothetical protein
MSAQGERTRGAAWALFAWGSLQLVLGLGLLAWAEGAPALLLLGGALALYLGAAWCLLLAHDPGPRLLPAVSMPVLLVAVGTAAAAVGLTAGLWLVLVGAEIAVFGLIWLWREMRQERRPPR